MKKLWLLSGLCSCSLLFDRLSLEPCDPDIPARCVGETLIFCEPGLGAEIQEVCALECHEDFGGFCGSCGDGDVQPNELCDDGNDINGDGCDDNCAFSACGNGAVAPGEECDDGDLINDDGCDENCTITACGNLIVTSGEECDDGFNVGDECFNDCTQNRCGDGSLNANEECDDQNRNDGDGCAADCLLPSCGDGFVDLGEECDDGFTQNNDCLDGCILPSCGDGLIQDLEECDDANSINGDGCDNNCLSTGCFNGIATAGELCYQSVLFDASNNAGVFTGHAVALDVTGDGLLDIVDGQGSGLSVLENRGDGTFTLSRGLAEVNSDPINGMLLTNGDLNNDGKQDLLFAGAVSLQGQIFVQNDAGFEAPISIDLVERRDLLSLQDMNNDGDLDLITFRKNGAVKLFVGNGDGTFQAPIEQSFVVGSSFGPSFVTVGDTNNDQVADLIVPGPNNEALVLLGGAAGFVEGAPTAPIPSLLLTVALADLDNNGALDLIIPAIEISQTLLLRGNGDGTFQASQVLLQEASLFIAQDLNQDGNVDLALSSSINGSPVLRLFSGDGFGAMSLSGTSPFFATDIVRIGAADLFPGGSTELFVVEFEGLASVLFEVP